jgi:hypothetical protein
MRNYEPTKAGNNNKPKQATFPSTLDILSAATTLDRNN